VALGTLEQELVEPSTDAGHDIAPGRAEARGDDTSDCSDSDDGDVTHGRTTRRTTSLVGGRREVIVLERYSCLLGASPCLGTTSADGGDTRTRRHSRRCP
jgi:hypothetical protein